ncbi:hypothetical protein [Candidatus Methylocalor cossyra]|uniref:hypothetical protein n=1 Tax=Candidatus Methylocalor cossyra TaxID=3108543 RepID=UPI0032B17ED4
MLLQYIKYSILILVFNNALAGESYESRTLTTKIVCNATEVTVTTTCVSGDFGPFPSCQAQDFVFSGKNGTFRIKGAGILSYHESEPPSLDYIATGWACASGLSGKNYLVASYYNGGNCCECELYMIYDLNGKMLTKRTKGSELVVSKKLGLTVQGHMREIKIPFHNK